MADPRQTLNDLIDLFEPRIRAAFLAAIQDVVENAILETMVRAIRDGDVAGAFRALGFSPAAMRPFMAMIETAYEQGGIFTGSTFPKYLNTTDGRAIFRFDVRNSRAETYLREQSSSLVQRLSDEALVNVRTTLTAGMQAGNNPRTVALDIIGRIDPQTGRRSGGIVGLTVNQEAWVRSARTKLETLDNSYFMMGLRDKRFDGTVAKAINSKTPLDADTISKLIGRYKDNALKYRGTAIARTEALQSLNAAEYEATLQAIETGAAKQSAVKRIWDNSGDSRVRHTHREMEGQKVGLNEPFVSPEGSRLMHPGDTSLGADASEIINCRCRVRTEIDWLDGLENENPPAKDIAKINAENERVAKSQVLTNGRKDKIENLVAYDIATGERLGATRGSRTSVNFSQAMNDAIDDPSRTIIAHHNHPSSSSFSPQDINMVVNKPGLLGLWAHGHNNNSFYAEKTGKIETLTVLRQIFDGLHDQLQNQVNDRNMTVDEAMTLHNHITSLAYANRGYIKYEYTVDKKTQKIIDNYQTFINKMLEYYK